MTTSIKNRRMTINRFLYTLLLLTLALSCVQLNQDKNESKQSSIAFGNLKGNITIPDKEIEIRPDSLKNLIFKIGEQYFKISTLDSILAIHGEPAYYKKAQWGMSTDSLMTVGYPKSKFRFLGNAAKDFELESIVLFDTDVELLDRICAGKTTGDEIIRSIGLPDYGYNDPGKSLPKSEDTTGNKSTAVVGDTVTFVYYFLNQDDYAMSFSMTYDTLRETRWIKNMN